MENQRYRKSSTLQSGKLIQFAAADAQFILITKTATLQIRVFQSSYVKNIFCFCFVSGMGKR